MIIQTLTFLIELPSCIAYAVREARLVKQNMQHHALVLRSDRYEINVEVSVFTHHIARNLRN